MRHVDMLRGAINGLIDAGITPVPMEIVIIAKAIGPHTMRTHSQDGPIKTADVMFADGVGMTFDKDRGSTVRWRSEMGLASRCN